MTAGQNGQRHLKAIYSLLSVFGIFIAVTVFEAGSFVNAQEAIERDGERRQRQLDLTDHRVRLIETVNAITNTKLERIQKDQDTIQSDQKEILRLIRERLNRE